MAVSATLLALLQQHESVTYTVVAQQAFSIVDPDSGIVRAMIAGQDGQPSALILVPQDHLIDLDQLNVHFKSRVEALSMSEVRRHYACSELLSVPAIPGWQDLPVISSSAMDRFKHVALDTGDGRHLIRMPQASFTALCGRAKIAEFSTSAPTLSLERSRDESRIIDSVKQFTERRIRQRLEETLELPPLPSTAQHIIQLRGNADANIDDLTALVESDPSLAAQVVSWAASPYYSAPGKIKSVHDAIVRVLGFDMVLNMALGLTLGKSLSMRALSREDIEQYWADAIIFGTCAEALAKLIPTPYRPSPGLAYLGGLLHNFGLLVLAEVFPVYLQQLRRAQQANAHLHTSAIESHVLGISGDEVASWLLENWSMPEEVVVALRYQHCPQYRGPDYHYARLNFLTGQLLGRSGIGEAALQNLQEDWFTELHLEQAEAIERVRELSCISRQLEMDEQNRIHSLSRLRNHSRNSYAVS